MLYSRFDPVAGVYDYFEAGDPLAAINDDLPTPRMPPAVSGRGHEIGLPSVECGRELPSGAVHVGRGEFPEGHVTPPSHVRLSGTEGDRPWSLEVLSFLAGALSVGAVWLWWRR